MSKTATLEKPTRASLEKRIAELEARDKALLAEQLALESDGMRPSEDMRADRRLHADAEAVLAGATGLAPAVDPGNRLFQIIRERGVIKKAVELGRLRLAQFLNEQAREIARDLEAAWQANIKATAALILQLETLSGERERLRAEWCARVGLDVRPALHVEGSRVCAPQSECWAFMEAGRRLNLIGHRQ